MENKNNETKKSDWAIACNPTKGKKRTGDWAFVIFPAAIIIAILKVMGFTGVLVYLIPIWGCTAIVRALRKRFEGDKDAFKIDPKKVVGIILLVITIFVFFVAKTVGFI